ncbi:epimerase [Paenibacillus yonginensis]|uniref:Epimerase n=1 Tax=Paenibacillus yonginensis TaxID=1462996 RepID=A0A1B1N027_9BACL|nr:NAD-dependent epimerase/dehydratase family protein [Paenibacillus yonginensis]ANS74782.1 epimerase [Paenibacillus yonginensis]
MKKAIVLGATGGTGSAITAELIRRNIETIAFGRSERKLKQLHLTLNASPLLSLAVGDAFDAESIIQAAQSADVIIHCVAVPYNEMIQSQLPLGETVLTAASALGKKLVIIDGIYPYGKAITPRVSETHPKQPHTRKGQTKLAFEQLVFSPRWQNLSRMIVRLPDYYGPTANKSSYLGMTMEAIAAGRPAMFVGSLKVPREYIYLPDAAYMIAELAACEEAYNEEWNLPGSGIITGHELVRLARQAAGMSKPVLPLNKLLLRMSGWFDPVVGEIVEMYYLTKTPVILDGSKYTSRIGPLKATPYQTGIPETIKAIQAAKQSARQAN